VALFLGGWNDPFGLIGYYYAEFTAAGNTAGLLALNVIGAGMFVGKMLLLVFVQMWIRWTLPRPRIDQVLYACVKVLLPLSCVVLLGGALWQLFVPSRPGVPWVDYDPYSWAELTAESSSVALIVQILLTALGLALFFAVCGWVGYAAVTGRRIKQRLTDPERIDEESEGERLAKAAS
jgi:hypothetical protein